MRRFPTYTLAALTLALGACSQTDDDPAALPATREIMLSPDYTIEAWQAAVATRAADLPAPELDMVESVGIFAVNDAEVSPVFDNQEFFYRHSDIFDSDSNLADLRSSWLAGNDWIYYPQKTWTAGAKYVFVGYAPRCAAGVAATRSDDGEIAEFTWEGLSSISATDHLLSTCVGRTAKSSANEAVPLSLKHLMARLRFCFKLGPHYADLRKIVVKRMEVSYAESRSMTLSVTYTKDGTEYTPTHRWLRGESGTGTTTVALRNEPGVKSITLQKGVGYQALASLYYEPGDPLTMFNIIATYDVYDNAGNLLRENDRAVSAVNLLRTVKAGYYYDVLITIEPSYLYVLSDDEPDSDGGMIIP